MQVSAVLHRQHEAGLLEEVARLVRFVPRCRVVEVFPQPQGLLVQQGCQHVEIGTDERLRVAAQGVDFGVTCVVRLHFRKTAQIEPVFPILFGGIIEPSALQKSDIFQVIDDPVRFCGMRWENALWYQLVRS